MTIVQLEYLLAVANHGSFSTAAEYCFVSTAALSMQVSNLEAELGVILLDRSQKPIAPTEAGRAFLEQGKEAIAAFYKARERINDIRGQLTGTLRIGVIPTISPYLMPEFVPRFMKRCPGIKFYIQDLHTADLVEALAVDKIDIAILSGGQSEVKIREIDLFDDKLYMYVSPDNELFGRREILIEEIDVRKLLILSEGNCLRNQTLELCRARKAVDPQFDFVRSSLENLVRTAERTGGMTVIPGMVIRYIPEARRDRIIPFGRVDAKRRITMAVSPTYVRESLVEMVKESIMEVARDDFALSEFLVP